MMTRSLPRAISSKATRSCGAARTRSQEIARFLVGLGYEPVTTVIGRPVRPPGRHPGLWPAAALYPTRLDFFGDEIDTLRRFDPATQSTFKHVMQQAGISQASC